MTRRILSTLLLLAPLLSAESAHLAIRGRLETGSKPALVLPDGRRVSLESDESTMKVLADDRLKDSDFEAGGHWEAPDRFAVDHLHMRSLFVYKEGKRLMVSYWCDVCYIRTYSPGKCWCCQKYTDLDLKDPDQP